MRNLFNMDNGLFRFLGRMADLMILNLLFILCCIPVVTAGASLTAMYYVALKLWDNEEGYISRNFFHSFRQNFKQSTILWLITLAVGFLFFMDFRILSVMEGSYVKVLQIMVSAVAIISLIVAEYTFPVLSRFDNSIKNTLRNALLMAIVNFPYTLVILIILVAPIVVTLINAYTIWWGILVWLLIGFALCAYGKAYLYQKIFIKYMPEQTEEENPDLWVLDEEIPENVELSENETPYENEVPSENETVQIPGDSPAAPAAEEVPASDRP